MLVLTGRLVCTECGSAHFARWPLTSETPWAMECDECGEMAAEPDSCALFVPTTPRLIAALCEVEAAELTRAAAERS